MFTAQAATTWLTKFGDAIATNKAYLSDLDTPIGDGDHGNNMARGMTAVQAALATQTDADLTTVFKTVAMALISKVGGASGPLYGTAFLEMAKASKAGTTDLPTLLAAALAGIEKRGGAQAGDKTMLDVWVPVVAAVQADKLDATLIATAVDSTKPMIAKKGRASYLGERAIGHLDPGAVSSGYLFTALLETEAQA
ncbi:Dihydroxyacetone kinase, L subunit [Lactobacillus delbrueckii subsp. bulgaricus ND02] [Lactiplantibacillus mudanjiangensis]|uniref:dihydroxyacetone kinase subunit DhaL n=1 Tax=Lactiplantibacillus mudanjiangensis TaxID=1296538 RepID=UPI001014EA49|nr:dihydroxyacetone kinase subunit DhaL [Lactiplantibacillus mudanjiangensis]VDG32087.1 Dihydroxyacetone kinase, L subunit [Lactobacillus delbrueckii subsp. bulgaricus ND02] [Lactiplantibacillus mudanjiangensis]